MITKEITQVKTKEEVIEILKANGIPYTVTSKDGSESICISFDKQKNCPDTPITLKAGSKEICKVYPKEIMYIAIENRKSVLYLTDRKIETNYPLDYWKEALDEKAFAQPHYSFIVNLNYVDGVTKDFVTVKSADIEYKVYTSSRKLSAFKKAVLCFKGEIK